MVQIIKIEKRDGSMVNFEPSKITTAIVKAFSATSEVQDPSDIAEAVTLTAIHGLEHAHLSVITVEDVQNHVESALCKCGYPATAKAYILYRAQHQKSRAAEDTLLDYKKLVNGYVGTEKDWRTKENSTVTNSLGGLILSNSGAVTANYWLSEIYDEEIANAHKNADIHIHDLSMLSGYCFTGDTRVKTLDGKNPTFKELVDNKVKELWVFAFDKNANKIVPAKAINPRVTRTTNKLTLVRMEDGTIIKSTPDHLYMMRDGSYQRADKLRANDSVMPLYIGEDSKYASISQAWCGGKKHQYLHRWVAEETLGRELAADEVVHHIDGDKHNNTPENLAVMKDTEHRALSVIETMKTDKWKSGNNARLVAYNKSDSKRSSVSKIARSRVRNAHGYFVPFAYNAEYDPTGTEYNHRIRQVKTIALDSPVEVYDLTVPEYSNFAVEGNVFVHNCAGWSLKQLITDGLGGVTGRITSAPAKHLSTLCNQMVNFLGIMQNEWAGAQAFSSFDTYLAPFVKIDNLTYAQTKQCIQSFIYGVNTPSRWGTQAPFTNITLDWTVPNDLAELPAIVGGEEQDFCYKDCKKEMDMVNKAFIETMVEGDAEGRGFQYPIPTYSITKDFDWSDTENNKLLFEMTSKYGTPYFSNYVNSDMNPSDVRSMCPLFGKQNVLVMDDYSKEFHVSSIENLYKGNKEIKEYSILLNGETKRARINRFDGLKFYSIKTVSGQEVVFSNNHTNLTLNGLKRTDELTTDDYLPFNVTPIEGKGLGYDEGVLVGAFLGDGTIKDDYSLTYSLNETSKAEIMSEIIKIAEKKGAKININTLERHCTNVTITSKMLRGLIEDYVHGTNAFTKELDVKCINRSMNFREGILAGYYATDGGNHNRIYSASKKLIDSVCTMLTSMGIASSICVDDRDSSTTLSDNPVYCIRFYDMQSNASCYKDVFIKKDNYMWFKIASVEPVETNATVGYCFEVLDDEEPYFTMPNGLVTHNCRLRLDLRELRKKSGGYFGSGESTGSVGVVTINMPRIAYLATDENDFYVRLDKIMDITARSLKMKREVITKLLNEGLYPYTKRYLGTFKNHFSTIGLIGMNEAGLNANWLRADMTDPRTQEFTKKVLGHMRNRLSDYQEKYGDLYNLEATPAESTSYRLAKHDREKFPDIITAGKKGETPYYTNSSNLPVDYTSDIFDALDIQDGIQTLYTSGTVFHAFLGEKLPDWKAAAQLVRTIATNYKLPYYTLSPTYSVCPEHGYLAGEQKVCPICGKVTEVYSRITGYYRPVQNWNDGKLQEYKDRTVYDAARSMKMHAPTSAPKAAEVVTKDSSANEGVMLFTTPTCPNCKMAKKYLDDAGINYTVVDATEPSNADLVGKLGIMQAPTMIVTKDGETKKYVNVSNIIKFIKN